MTGAIPAPTAELNVILTLAGKVGVPVPKVVQTLDQLFFDPSPLETAADTWEKSIAPSLVGITTSVAAATKAVDLHWEGAARSKFDSWVGRIPPEIKEVAGVIPHLATTFRSLAAGVRDLQKKAVPIIVKASIEGSALAGSIAATGAAALLTAGPLLYTFFGDIGNLLDQIKPVNAEANAALKALTSSMGSAGAGAALLNQAVQQPPAAIGQASQWQPE